MIEDKSVYQIQARIFHGEIKPDVTDITCPQCSLALPNECTNCGSALVPGNKTFPYHRGQIIVPTDGWVAIEPTISGIAPLPNGGLNMNAYERARVRYQELQYTQMSAWLANGHLPRIRLVGFELRETLLENDKDHNVFSTKKGRRKPEG